MIIVPWAMLDQTLKQILARSLKAVIDQPQLTQAFFSSSVSSTLALSAEAFIHGLLTNPEKIKLFKDVFLT
jgi:hypothetical protein